MASYASYEEIDATGLQITPEDLNNDNIQEYARDVVRRMKLKRDLDNLQKTAITTTVSPPQDSDEAIKLSTGKDASALEGYMKFDKKKGAILDRKKLVDPKMRALAETPHIVKPRELGKTKVQAQAAKKATAGAQWFDMPKTDLTPELKRDLQLLKMRSVLDPKRFYKKDNKRDAVPEYSQVGTIIGGPTDARLNNKERKRTLAQEVLQEEESKQKFKSKYNEIQAAKTSGKKAHYKAMSAKRKPKSRG